MRYLDLRTVRVPLLLAALVMAFAPAAHAFPVTSCGTTCNTNCELAANLVCDLEQTGVILGNGADLDMRGYDIRCVLDDTDPMESTGGWCGNGVRITGANSVVFSSASQDPSDPTPRVRGPWLNAISCTAGATNSRVSGITISQAVEGSFVGPANPAVNGCAIVENNTIIGRPVLAIGDTGGIVYRYPDGAIRMNSNGIRASGNYIDGFMYGISRLPTSTNSINIDDNVINLPDRTFGLSFFSWAIDILHLPGNPAGGTVRNNVVVGNGTVSVIRSMVSEPNYVFEGNTCRKGHLGCTPCINSLQCAASTPCVSP